MEANQRPDYDQVIQDIADYVLKFNIESALALDTARNCLMDTIGCGLLALRSPECCKHLGPFIEGTIVPYGARVPGTQFRLDPMKAAWDIGCMNRWLDYNDTWLAAEWGHPSDNLAAILALTDYLTQQRCATGKAPLRMRTVLEAMIMAHEIQGVLALENSFNRLGLDHVLLVRVASTALAIKLMGGNRQQLMAALSHAWADGCALRIYRQAPNTGSRKSWAAGDASARAVRLADLVMRGEMGIPTALTAKQWGFYAVYFGASNGDQAPQTVVSQRQLKVSRPYGTYVMEQVLFKLRFAAEFHSQTACEAALILYPQVKNRIEAIRKIVISSHESALRIIAKQGPLHNPADRDHCLQYVVAVLLLFGELKVEHYEDSFHKANRQIDRLREKIQLIEDKGYSEDYRNPQKRSVANAVQVFFNDGSCTERVAVEYPLGHSRRRAEGIGWLESKFKMNLATRFPAHRCERIFDLCKHQKKLEQMPVNEFMDLFVI